MQILVEIYDLQQQVKNNLSQKRYQDIEALFTSLQRQCLQEVLKIQFIFNPQVDDLDVILSQLQDWQQETPESYYPYLFLASFWHTIASKERGIQTMDRVTSAQSHRFSVANDQFFYWALKTLEFNPECVAAYHMLLEASGLFGLPDWLTLPSTQPINFPSKDYSKDDWAFLSSFPGYTVPQRPINIILEPLTPDEQKFTPFYWLKNILNIEPEHIESRKVTIRFLSPRWYGDENYENANRFLASDYCSGLSPLQINILQREKEYDLLTSYNTLSSRNYKKELSKREEGFIGLINTPLADKETSLTLFEYIDFCYYLLTSLPDERQRPDNEIVDKIYHSLHHIVKLASPWILFYRSNEIFNLLISFMKMYELEDHLKVFDELANQTQYRNLTSPAEVLYSALAANFPLANISHAMEHERSENYYIYAEKKGDYHTFSAHIFVLCKMGYALSIKPVLERFATEKRAINAAILCYEIYHDNASELADMFSIESDVHKANVFLDIAVQQGASSAILIKSRDLEDVIDASSNASERAELFRERERLLKFNIQQGDAVSQYDYACSLIASNDEQRIHQGLFVEAPKVLAEARVRLDQLAYIAYLYAFCAFNARGMPKNLFVMDFWINQALVWDPDPGYVLFLEKVKEGAGLALFYNFSQKRDKGKVPEEMKKIMNTILQ